MTISSEFKNVSLKIHEQIEKDACLALNQDYIECKGKDCRKSICNSCEFNNLLKSLEIRMLSRGREYQKMNDG